MRCRDSSSDWRREGGSLLYYASEGEINLPVSGFSVSGSLRSSQPQFPLHSDSGGALQTGHFEFIRFGVGISQFPSLFDLRQKIPLMKIIVGSERG